MMIYRFKTEKEFIKDYGFNWVSKCHWNPDGCMNHLFGTTLPIHISDENFKNPLFKIQIRDKYFGQYRWTINMSMLTLKEPNYNPKIKIERVI